jgi:hypothetical protein
LMLPIEWVLSKHIEYFLFPTMNIFCKPDLGN